MKRIAHSFAIRRAIELNPAFNAFVGGCVDLYVAIAIGIKAHRLRIARAYGVQIASRVWLSPEDDRGGDVRSDRESLFGGNFYVRSRGAEAGQQKRGQGEQAARVLRRVCGGCLTA